MTDKEKAQELALTLLGEDQNPEPLVEILMEMAQWKKEQMINNAEPAEVGFWNQRGLSILFDKSLERLGFEEDEKVKVLIIKVE